MALQRLNHTSITYFFVMDGANFETPSLLLAESIRSALGGYPDIVAYTPNSKLGAINDVTRKMMEILNVDIRGFDDQLVKWSPKYPHGIKFLRLGNGGRPNYLCSSIRMSCVWDPLIFL